jgi:hypothetical protein
MRLIKAMALLVPLLPAAGGLAQAPQGADRTPEGNLGSGAAMSGAQSQSMGTPPAAGATVPPQQTHSPRPPGVADTPARQRPEGNLGSGAAMSGAQSQSMGTPPAAGATVPPQPTHSPTPPGGTGTGTGNAPAR